MALALPNGARTAVCITVDFDAQCQYNGQLDRLSPGILARGEFDAEVGTPRLLRLFEREGIRTTWCTPGHTLITFPNRIREVLDAGHEVAAHGAYHEFVPSLDEAEERRLMDLQISQHEKIVGARPRGYRSPSWNFSESTLRILEEYGFDWDSSLMGRDFVPYRPRPVVQHREEPNEFGAPSSVLELPVSDFMNDLAALEFVPGMITALKGTAEVFERWRDHFDYAHEHEPGGVVILTVHGGMSGRAHALKLLARFIEHVKAHDGVWFGTLSDVFDRWSE